MTSFRYWRAFILFLFAIAATAQERTGAITGLVRDPTGGVVVDAAVDVRSLATGVTRGVTTDASGAYRVALLEPGTYDVTATRAGFKASRHEAVLLELDREAVVDHVLELGQVTEEVVVRGEGRLVEASPSAVSSLVDSTSINELPLNGRDYVQLTALQAGAPEARVQARNINNGYGLQFSIAGSRPIQNSFLLDGVSLTTYNGSTPGSINGVNLGVDAIQEFSVHASAPGAQYGRTAGGIVHAVTRSGTSEYHGSLFYFHRNDNLDARNFFDGASKPEFRRHQFGASLGGPVVRNRTFFFANYEALREVRGNTQIDTTLSEEARSGAVDPIMAKVASLYPLPNLPVDEEDFVYTGLFRFENSEVGDEDFVTTRVDHHFGDFDRLFFRYNFDDGARVDETNFALGQRRNRTRNQSLALEHTHIFSPRLINTARFGFLRTLTVGGETKTQVPGTDDPTLAFLPGRGVIGIIDVAGLSEFPGGSGALDSDEHAFNSFQYSDDVTWMNGRHTLQFGGRLERTRFNTDSQNRVSGEYHFPGIAELLTNQPDRFRAQIPGSDTVRGFRQWIGAWYVQDRWQLRPRITLELGLRYEAASVPAEVNGKISNLDELTDATMRVGEPLFDNPSLKNFSPRIGLAYDIFGNGRTLLRAGYGVYPDLILSHFLLLAGLRNPPFFQRGATTAKALEQGDFPKNGFLVFASSPDADLRAERIPRDLSQPYVQQWNFNIEQRLSADATLRLAYIGSHGLHLSSYTEDANLVEPVTRPDGRLFFPGDGEKINPHFSWIRNRTFDAQSSYHGLQTQFRRRFQDGLLAQASYSFSKSIDDSSMFFAFNESSNAMPLPLNGNPRFYRGPSSFDVRHSLVVSVVWEPPSPAGRRARQVFGGWRLGLIATYSSGFPLSARVGYDAAGTKTSASDAMAGQTPDLVPGASNNPVTGNPNRWVDVAAFRSPEPGFLGNLGRNTIRGPDLANADVSLVKQLDVPSLGDGATLDFRFEFFNLFNRTNFDQPTVDRMLIFTPTSVREDAGRITSARDSRKIQFGCKLRF